MPVLEHVIRNVSIYNILPPSLTTLGASASQNSCSGTNKINKKEKQYKLFEGDMVIVEDMSTNFSSNSSNPSSSSYTASYCMASLPKSSITIEFRHKNTMVFCHTTKIDNLAKYDEVVNEIYTPSPQKKKLRNQSQKYEIVMNIVSDQLGKMRVPLEVRVQDPKEQLRFHDLLVRIRDEFELIDDMYYM